MNNNEFGANLAKETLTGDIATFLIDRLRQFPKTYQEMSEKEQEAQIEAAKSAAKELVSKAVNIVASGGREVIMAELGKITVDKQIKAVVEVNSQYAEDLIAVQGKPILIVTNSDAEFTGGGEDLKADPDQREIPALMKISPKLLKMLMMREIPLQMNLLRKRKVLTRIIRHLMPLRLKGGV